MKNEKWNEKVMKRETRNEKRKTNFGILAKLSEKWMSDLVIDWLNDLLERLVVVIYNNFIVKPRILIWFNEICLFGKADMATFYL